MRLAWVILVLTQVCQAQEAYRIMREGPYWVKMEGGFLPAFRRLTVTSPGKVRSIGEPRGDISYILKRRVKAKDFETARRLLAGPGATYTVRGDAAVLAVGTAKTGWDEPELEIHVPQALRETSLRVKEGGVEAYDLYGAIDVESGSGPVVMDRIEGSLTARTGGGEIRLGRVSGALHCLSGGGGIFIDSCGRDSLLETAGGEVFVRIAEGMLRANTGGGNIQVMRAMAAVDARTNGGMVDVVRAAGKVFANTSSGGIQVGLANGVDCQSASGFIQLRDVSGPVKASTMRGSILAQLGGTTLGDSFLNTRAGDITVSIPSNLMVTVQAEGESAGAIARIYSDFPEIRIMGGVWPGFRPVQAQGALNGGGPLLRLSATGGQIRLRRQE